MIHKLTPHDTFVKNRHAGYTGARKCIRRGRVLKGFKRNFKPLDILTESQEKDIQAILADARSFYPKRME